MAKPTITIAVRRLVERVLRSGDLEFGISGVAATQAGIEAHRVLQQKRPAAYRSEVHVSQRIETKFFILKITGRIDGIYPDQDPMVIEEIKSSTRPPDRLAAAASGEHPGHQQHWAQVKCYAHIRAQAKNLDAVCTRLTYVYLPSGTERSFDQVFSRKELAVFFNVLVDKFLFWESKRLKLQLLRDRTLRHLDFPFPRYRQGQQELVDETEAAMAEGIQLYAQAPTGIGKTAAVLYPAVKALAKLQYEKIFYLTARTTGRLAAEQTVKLLTCTGMRLKSLTLTAKDKICFHDTRDCGPDHCAFARGYYDRLDDALTEALDDSQDVNRAWDQAFVTALAQKHTLCPFELSLELSLWADLIIGDYNYVLDPRVYIKRLLLERSHRYAFLIDEAHNLVDRSREMFSAELRKSDVLAVRREIKTLWPHLYRALGKINAWLLEVRKILAEYGKPDAAPELPEDFCELLRVFKTEAEQTLLAGPATHASDRLLDLLLDVNQFIKIATDFYREGYATLFEPAGNDLKITVYCIDPAHHLQKAFAKALTVIFFSATLTPMAYFQRILGSDATCRSLSLYSPFPPKNQLTLVADRISTLYRRRQHTAPHVARLIAAVVKAIRGNYLVFCPSYQYLNLIHQHFRSQVPQVMTRMQYSGMPESERETFLSAFKADNEETLVGFAVLGGIFGEGIDLKGERLTGAVVVGVGHPPIALKREIIRDFFAADHDSGYEFAYLYPGINRVLQAAGRVIRSETDHGVILLIDSRYASARYNRLLPEDWNPQRVHPLEPLRGLLSRFWKSLPSLSDPTAPKP